MPGMCGVEMIRFAVVLENWGYGTSKQQKQKQKRQRSSENKKKKKFQYFVLVSRKTFCSN